jgi:hypothetical protein
MMTTREPFRAAGQRPASRWGVVVGLVVAIGAPSLARAQTTAADPILSGYQLLYRGDRTAASRHIERLRSERPDDLAARFGWLTIEHDRLEFDPARMPEFERVIDSTIEMASARSTRNRRDADALFYLANAHFLRAAYRFEFDKGMWGAGRDGANAKSYIEAYLRERPGDADAYLVLGAYNYYADIIPRLFKLMRFLFFIPAGNRVEGLEQLEQAAARGRLFAPLAQVLLVDAYSSYEGRGDEALAISERLHRQYPGSDDAGMLLAGVYAGPRLEDHERAAAQYEVIADRRRSDASIDGVNARYRALVALSGQHQEAWRIADAIAVLTPTIDARPATPAWVMPQFLLRRANYRALLDDPAAKDDATRALQAARSVPAGGPVNWQKAANELMVWIDGRRRSGEATQYAALVPANRLVAERKWDEARRLYDAIRARAPQNLSVQYRLAYLDFASGQPERALPVFVALAANRAASRSIRSMALLHAGRAHDLAGRRQDALRAYQRVADAYDDQRAADFARVGLLSPYRARLRTTS